MMVSIWKRVTKFWVDTINKPKSGPSLNIIPRSQHTISRGNISNHALKVLYRLKDAGYQAHLVGGGVRDLLLGLSPKDFDVATNAEPEEVKALFRNSRLIGRRFRLAHILFGGRDIIEVATFRASHRDGEDGEVDETGRIMRDNVFGSIEEDALRRDFTINALYYDIRDFSIRDYAGGLADIEARRLRLIGDPMVRYQEDPVRMLRAVRFAAKLHFQMAPEVEAPIPELGPMLRDVPPARLFEEVLKLFQSGHGVRSLELLQQHGLLGYLFPSAATRFDAGDEMAIALIRQGLVNTDLRVNAGKPITPAFLYALFLWPAVERRAAQLERAGEVPMVALQLAAETVLDEQLDYTSLPKRFSLPMREIWFMQGRLLNYTGKRALRLLEHPRFRAGYDLFCLRASIDAQLQDRCRWWSEIQHKEPEQQAQMARHQQSRSMPRRRRRRPKSKKRAPAAGGAG